METPFRTSSPTTLERIQTRTDYVGLEKHFPKLANVGVPKAFQDADLARKHALLFLGLGLALAQIVQIALEVAHMDHLHGVPLSLRPVQRLHDSGKRALA